MHPKESRRSSDYEAIAKELLGKRREFYMYDDDALTLEGRPDIQEFYEAIKDTKGCTTHECSGFGRKCTRTCITR